MSSGQGNDLEETQKQIKNPTPIINGKNWLRHLEFKQSALIDQMLLGGLYSVEEIARELDRRFKPLRSLEAREKRVQEHIEHLQDGDSRGKSSGMKPHKLRLKEVGGKWRFDV